MSLGARQGPTHPSRAERRRSMRILHVTLQGMESGQGAETHVKEVRRQLGLLGAQVTGVQPAPSTGSVSRIGRLLQTIFRACWALPRSDAFYMRHHPAGVPLALLAQVLSRRRVEEVNGDVGDFASVRRWVGPLVPLLRRASTYQLRTADTVIVVSDAMARAVREQAGVEAVVVPNRADLQIFRPSVDDDKSPQPVPYVLFFGALTSWQGLVTLLDATAQQTWPEGVRLVVIGDGPLKSLVIQRLAGGPHIYLGALPQVDVARYTRHALATLSPKLPEAAVSSPLKVVESIACGTPVIVSDCGQQAQIVRDHGVGVVLDDPSPRTLAEAVARLNRDSDAAAALGRACLDLRSSLSWDSIRPALGKALDLTEPG